MKRFHRSLKKGLAKLKSYKTYLPKALPVIFCVGVLSFSNWKLSKAIEVTDDTDVVNNTGVVDTGVVDAGVVDTGIIDTEVANANAADSGVTDTSVTETSATGTSATGTSTTGNIKDIEVKPAEGDVIEEHISIYIPEATVKYIMADGESVPYTYFLSGRILPYDVDIWIDEIDEMDFFYMLVESEVGNQSSLAKRLVADCVLNQRSTAGYPDTIKGVILKHNDFEVVSTGMIFNAHPQQSTKQCVDTELETQIDYGVMYFRTDHYHPFGVPYEHVGDCWFSKPIADSEAQWHD